MNVVVAEHSGVCYGVKRALDLAYDAAAQYDSIQTLGPLIHNPQVVQELAERGLGLAEDVSNIQARTVVIRSHGVTPEVLDALEEQKLEVIDATCPHVLRAQRAAHDLSAQGFTVLVVGEADHPEVQGLLAWGKRGGGTVYCVSSPSDLPSTLQEPLGIVVQTTQTRELLQSILDALDARGLNYELRDTICSATNERQKAAADLAQNVDAMVVVGGKNSSNTTHLADICAQYCNKVFHVEMPSELVKQDFEGIETVGLTAGASTPDSQINAVVDCLRSW